MITKEIAITLKHGTVLEHRYEKNADGTARRCRINGKCKTWKTNPKRFEIPVKAGLYTFGYITEINGLYWNVK